MDVFVFPSRYEGLGLVIVEAQVSGLKVVASNMVPREAKVNNNVDFININENIDKWISAILKENNRIDICCKFDDYDIMRQALKLQSYYRGFYEYK